MYNALRSSSSAAAAASLPNQMLRRRTAEIIRFRQLFTGPGKMEETDKPEVASQSKSENVPMSSFGEGYATRSDEEGFGGTYGGNAEEMPEQDKIVHGKVPEYDTDQGSEVNQKEMARNQRKPTK